MVYWTVSYVVLYVVLAVYLGHHLHHLHAWQLQTSISQEVTKNKWIYIQSKTADLRKLLSIRLHSL